MLRSGRCDDAGADLPPALQGARDRVFALGIEIGLSIPAIRGRIGARYLRDIDVCSRPEGQTLVFQLALLAWQPAAPAPPAAERR